jgi:hypothetical protein
VEPGLRDAISRREGKPEVRKYKAIYVIKDAETGVESDEVAVTALP